MDEPAALYSQSPTENFIEFEKFLRTVVTFTEIFYENAPGSQRSGFAESAACFALFNTVFLPNIIDFVLFGHIKFISCFHPVKYINSVGNLVFQLYECLATNSSPIAIVLLSNVMEENADLAKPLNYGIKRLKDIFKLKLEVQTDVSSIELIVAARAVKRSL